MTSRGAESQAVPSYEMTDGQMTDGQMTDGQMTDGQMTDGQMTDGQMTDGQALTHTHIFTLVLVETTSACDPEALIAGHVSSSTKGPATLSHFLQQVNFCSHSECNAATVLGSCPFSLVYSYFMYNY